MLQSYYIYVNDLALCLIKRFNGERYFNIWRFGAVVFKAGFIKKIADFFGEFFGRSAFGRRFFPFVAGDFRRKRLESTNRRFVVFGYFNFFRFGKICPLAPLPPVGLRGAQPPFGNYEFSGRRLA